MLAFKSINRDFCDLTADGEEYLLALDTNYDNAILRLNSDLEITDQKYIARFFGGSFKGVMSTGESHIAYLIQPMGNDPTVGQKGANFVQLQKADLTIGCAIEQTDDSPILMEDVDGSVFDQTDITDNIPYPVTITPFGVVVDDYPVEKNIVCQGNVQ
ncbi:hypothetical protein KK062_15830 [Fulvivirgaceae bacterium PWU5]|uniref:Uncharacterized protein n=2 Tax=Dawidia cretensis TaxID=2782350 RepID=A0AAP2E0L1_9BACT|nr:hypothetical protein [Dawidia cretensis]